MSEQIKYFKEKRVMEYKRDMSLAKIAEDDAKEAALVKKNRQSKGWFS